MKKYKELSEGYRDYHNNRTGFAKRRREDDEYHTPDPVTQTHKIGFHVSKDDGEKHHRTVTISNSTKSHEEAKATARAHLEKQGYKIHEEVELDEAMIGDWTRLKNKNGKTIYVKSNTNSKKRHTFDVHLDKNSAPIEKNKLSKTLIKARHDAGEFDKHFNEEVDSSESHVEFRLDHRDKVKGDHKPTFADHEAKVSDTTDKATYVKVPSHKADSFKSAMKSKHGVKVELAEARMTAAMKLQRAFQREQEKTARERKAGEELLKKPVKEEFISEGAYEKAEENKKSADAAKEQGDMFAHHLHMADHHDNMAEWHASKGRHGEADRHAEKSEQHHEKAMSLKEDFHSKNLAKQELENKKNKGGVKGIVIAALKKKAGLDEVLNPSMGAGEYIKDFQQSDAPQFKGKSKEKKRMMGLAAYLQAKDKQVSEGVIQPNGSDKIETAGNQGGSNPELNGNAHFVIGKKAPKNSVKEEVVVEGRNEDDVPFDKPYKTATNQNIKDKSGALHSPMSRARDLARQAMQRIAPKSPIKPVKEEVEVIDEETTKVETKKYSWGTMKTIHKGASYSIPLHPEHHEHIAKMKDGQVHDIKTEDGRQWHVKREGDTVHFHGANGGPKTSVPHSSLKESVDLEEAFINGREYASHGLMHPDHAKMNLHKVTGHNVDFYAHGSGDKIEGKVTKNDGKSVHIKDTKGYTHKFKVTPHLPKQQNEEVQIDEQAPVAPVPDRKYIKGTPEWKAHKEAQKPRTGHPTNVKESIAIDEEGNLMAEKKTYSEFMSQLLEYEVDKNGRYVHKGNYGSSYKDPEGADDADDKQPKKAGRKVGSKVGPKANLGNSKLHQK